MKRIALLAVLLVALMAMTACGGEQTETEPMPLPTPIATYAFVSGDAVVSDTAGEIAEEVAPEADAVDVAEEPVDGAAASDEATAEDAPADTEATLEADAVDVAEEPVDDAAASDEATAEDAPADTEATLEADAVDVAEEPVDDAAASDEAIAEDAPADTEATPEADAGDVAEEPADDAAASDEATAEDAPATDEGDDPFAGLPAGVAAAMENADFSRGEQLTLQNACTGCHNLDPDVQMAGPTWRNLAETAATRVEGDSAIEHLYTSVTDPNAYIVEGFQPNIMLQTYGDTLSDQDLADILTYLLEAGE